MKYSRTFPSRTRDISFPQRFQVPFAVRSLICSVSAWEKDGRCPETPAAMARLAMSTLGRMEVPQKFADYARVCDNYLWAFLVERQGFVNRNQTSLRASAAECVKRILSCSGVSLGAAIRWSQVFELFKAGHEVRNSKRCVSQG